MFRDGVFNDMPRPSTVSLSIGLTFHSETEARLYGRNLRLNREQTADNWTMPPDDVINRVRNSTGHVPVRNNGASSSSQSPTDAYMRVGEEDEEGLTPRRYLNRERVYQGGFTVTPPPAAPRHTSVPENPPVVTDIPMVYYGPPENTLQRSPIAIPHDVLRDFQMQTDEPTFPNVRMRDLDFVDERGGPRANVLMRMRRIGGVDTFVPIHPTIRFTANVRRFIRDRFFQHLCDGNFISNTYVIDAPERRTHIHGRCQGLRNATNPRVERPFCILCRDRLYRQIIREFEREVIDNINYAEVDGEESESENSVNDPGHPSNAT
jgi:hypothetical protein